MSDNNKKEKRKKALLVILILLLLLILGICIIFHFSKPIVPSNDGTVPTSSISPASLDDNGNAIPGGYDPKSHDEILSELKKKQVTVTDKVSAQIAFPSGEKGTTGTWILENPASNNVTMQCEIVLGDRTVAKSVPIYPGQHIENITLLDSVTPGTYDVTASISYFNKDTKAYLGKAGYRIKLTVS